MNAIASTAKMNIGYCRSVETPLQRSVSQQHVTLDTPAMPISLQSFEQEMNDAPLRITTSAPAPEPFVF